MRKRQIQIELVMLLVHATFIASFAQSANVASYAAGIHEIFMFYLSRLKSIDSNVEVFHQQIITQKNKGN